MGIFEILLILVIAVIVIPPDDLPHVMRTVGKVLRELRLASNTVMRELSSAIDDDSPYNSMPRLDSRPLRTILAQSTPAPNAPTADSQSAASATTPTQAAPGIVAEPGSHPVSAPESASASSAEPATSSESTQPTPPTADVKP